MFSPIYISTPLHNGSTISAIGNYSTYSNNFIYQVPPGKIAALTRIIIYIGDDTSLNPDVYGGTNSPLTNGIIVSILNKDDSVLQYVHSNTVSSFVGQTAQPIKTNGDWASLCYDFNIVPDGGSSKQDIGLFRWTFARAGTALILSNEEKFCVTVRDDHTTLLTHRFTIQGLEAPESSHNIDLFLRELST